MSLKNFFFRIGMVLFLTTICQAGAAKRPNILFLLTDDQRFDTIGALGNDRIKTPNLDRLVEEGIVFENAYIMGGNSMAVCTPSRAALFSGRTLWNLESQGVWDFAISSRHPTFAEVLREGGYLTFATGKNDPGFGKNDHFARSFVEGDALYYRGGHRGQNRTPLFGYPGEGPGGRGERIKSGETFNADLFADACVEFLRGRKGREEPFLAYVPFMTPHDPLNAPEEFLKQYHGEGMKLPADFLPEHPFDAGVHAIRDEKLMKRPLESDRLKSRLAKYYALMTHTDAQIGRILSALDESGHADNTVVIFSSDNGLALGSHGLTGKQNVYEHSVKVPLVIRGPGMGRGEKRSQLCYLYDLYPTMCELAGVATPPTVEFQSLLSVIREAGAQHRETLFFSFMHCQRAVRNGPYKLLEFCVEGKRTTRLFDLGEDPFETRDLSGREEMQAVLTRMRRLLEKEAKHLNDGNSEAPHLREMSETFWKTYRAQAGRSE